MRRGCSVIVRRTSALPPSLDLDAEGQAFGRVLISGAANAPFEILAPLCVGDEATELRAAEKLLSTRDLRRERDLPQVPVGAERIALHPIHARFERDAEAIVEVINRTNSHRCPPLARIGPAI